MFKPNAETTLTEALNKTWRYSDISVWSIAELELSIICGNLPAARICFLRYFPGVGGESSEYSTGSSFRLKPRSQAWGYRERKPQGNSIQISAMETRPASSGEDSGEAPGIKCHTTYEYTVQQLSDDEQNLVSTRTMIIPDSLQRDDGK